MTTLCFYAHTDRHSRIYSCRSPRTCLCPWPFWHKVLILKFSSSPTGPDSAMAERSDSWDAFWCHGSFETFDATIPRSMLMAVPEKNANDTVIAYRDFASTICPRYQQGKNCHNRTNCPHFHPDFINEHWVVPDFHLP